MKIVNCKVVESISPMSPSAYNNADPSKLLSYQTAYDSSNPDCSPRTRPSSPSPAPRSAG